MCILHSQLGWSYLKYTFVPQKAKQNFAVISVQRIYNYNLLFVQKRKEKSNKILFVKKNRTLILRVIGNDEKTYNLYDKI